VSDPVTRRLQPGLGEIVGRIANRIFLGNADSIG